MKFPQIEALKQQRNHLIMCQRLLKGKAKTFQRASSKSTSLHRNTVNELTDRREKLKLIEMVLRQHNELKRMYAKVKASEVK